jgi:hypothetical protein
MKELKEIKGTVKEKEELEEGEFELTSMAEAESYDYFDLQSRGDIVKCKDMLNSFQMQGREPVVIYNFKTVGGDLRFREFDRLKAAGDFTDMHYKSVYSKLVTYGDIKVGMVVTCKKDTKGYMKVVPKGT